MGRKEYMFNEQYLSALDLLQNSCTLIAQHKNPGLLMNLKEGVTLASVCHSMLGLCFCFQLIINCVVVYETVALSKHVYVIRRQYYFAN